MKKIKIIASLAVLMIVAMVIIQYVMGSKAGETDSTASIPKISFTDFDGDGIVKDWDADFGSDANPLLILEIVPIRSYAEMGYMVSGCEPVDMSVIKNDWGLVGWYQSKFCGDKKIATDIGGSAFVDSRKFPDEIESGETISYEDSTLYNYGSVGYKPLKDILNEGVIQRTGGQETGSWTYSGGRYEEKEGFYEKVPNGTGKFILEGNTFNLVGNNNGNYVWQSVENSGMDTNDPDYTADVVWTKRSGQTYGHWTFNIVNNDVLKKEAFGEDVDPSTITAQVLTVTPYDLRKAENLSLIYDADLISIAGKTHDGSLVEKWEAYNIDPITKEHVVLTEAEKSRNTLAKNDLPWDAVLAIVRRMADEEPPGIILSAEVNDSSAMNCKKLCMMLIQSSPLEFQTTFLDTKKVVPYKLKSEYTASDGDYYTTGAEYKDPIDGYDLRTGVFYTTENNAPKEYVDWSQGNGPFYPYLWDSNQYSQEYMDYHNMLSNFSSHYGFVRNKVYMYNGSNAMFDLYATNVAGGDNEWAKQEMEKYYKEVLDYYDDVGEPKTGLSGNFIVRYLLQDSTMKRELKVLEVQPCNKFIYGNDGWQEYYVKLFPWLKGKLEQCLKVTTMPTWHFNSSIEDLNSEYDVIIFGVKQDVSNGLNGYNDSAMNTNNGKGLIYTSIGDIVNLDKHDQAMRYSGNDITAKKVKELESFMNGNKAVILDSGFMRRGVGSGVNTDVIDPSSNIYKFASMHKKEVEGVNTEYLFVDKQYNANTLRKAVAYETCRIEFVPYKVSEDYTSEGYPIEYTYRETEDNNKAIAKGSVTYADRNFQYSFMIRGKAGTVYEISLFVDVNGDGLYNDSDSNRIEGTEKATERVGGIVVYDANGNVVDPNKLNANTIYVLTKNLENTYQGIIPWKLEAHIANNTDSRNNVVKYATLKTTDATKKRISVLLMNPTPDMSEPDVFYRKYASWVGDTSRNYGFIRMDQISKFRTYLDAVDEYEITLDYLSNTKWLEKFKNNVAAWSDYLDSYDMLILGFNDNCTFTNNDVFYQGFMQFKDSGKSVITSHDMVKDTSENSNLRVKFDEELRQMLGQRRFSQNTIMLNNNSVNLLFTKGDYKAYNKKIDENTTWPGYFDNANRLFVSRGAGKADRDSFAPLGDGWTDENKETQYINIVNRGQITNYPYDIPDLIQVANTHAQNYQLDLENKDMAVWYTLTDQYTKTYADEAKNIMGVNAYNSAVTADKLGRGTYSSVECDGRNSYYIYNINNVTYTGLGHKTNMTDQEIKLFVNTMIAAYRSRPIPPGIEITNEDAIIEGSSATIYVPFDSNLDYEKSMIDVSYKVTDPSLLELTNREYELEYKDVTGITLQNIITYPIIDGVKSGTKVTGVPSARTPVKRDGEYYFQVPYSEIKDGAKTYQLTLWYADPGNIAFKQAKTVSVTIMQMPMFNLN